MTVTTTEPAPDAPRPARRSRRRALLILVALLVVGGGAYGAQRAFTTGAEPHDHSSHSEAPDLDPCTLVTPAEAAGVLGAIGQPREDGLGVVGEQVVCTIPLERDARFGANVGFANHDVASKYRGFAGRFEGLAEEVPDLGDEAIWLEPFRLVLVRLDDELLTVQMSDVFEVPADSRDKAIKIGAIAVRRLPNAEGA